MHKSQTGGKGIVKTCTTIRNGKKLINNIGSKSLHHFVQRLLVPSIRQHVAKPQILVRSDQNCSKQERQYWTECTEITECPSVILSDSSTESPVHILMLSIQAVRGLPHLCAPGIVPCIISFSRQLLCFLMV